MNKDDKKKKHNYFIVDSTAIIHRFILEDELKENDYLIIPNLLEEELKSFESKSVLSLLEAEGRLIRASPSTQSLEKVIKNAKASGDFFALSKIDLQIVALAIDFPSSIIYSDDNSVQNVCVFLNIKVISKHFSIKRKRVYYWKCTVCKSKYSQERETCIECGSPLKRFYRIN